MENGMGASHLCVWGHPRRYPSNVGGGAPVSYPRIHARIAARADYLVFEGTISIFEWLHALRPIDEVLTDI